MNKQIKIALLFTVIIFSTTNLANAKLEESTYTMKKGDTIQYVIDSFHDKLANSFGINVSNHTVVFQKGTYFNITVESVNSSYVGLELICNNFTITNVSQSYFSYINFAYKASSSSNTLEQKNKDGYHYYVSGDSYYQDFSLSYQSGNNFYNKTIIDNTYNWKTGWEEYFLIQRNAFQYTSKKEFNQFWDLELQISMVGFSTKATNPLPAFQLFSVFLLALIPIVRKMRKKNI